MSRSVKYKKIKRNKNRRTFAEVLASAKKATDGLGCLIDCSIRKPVAALNWLGITTDASCQGHLRHGFSYPWIDIETFTEYETGKFALTAKGKKDVKRVKEMIKEKNLKLEIHVYSDYFVRIQPKNKRWINRKENRKEFLKIVNYVL